MYKPFNTTLRTRLIVWQELFLNSNSDAISKVVSYIHGADIISYVILIQQNEPSPI